MNVFCTIKVWYNSYFSLQCTCLQKQTPSASGSPLSSQFSYREAGIPGEASLPLAAFFSADLSAACAQVQQVSAHDPKKKQQHKGEISGFSVPIKCFMYSPFRMLYLLKMFPPHSLFSSEMSILKLLLSPPHFVHINFLQSLYLQLSLLMGIRLKT